LHVYFTEAHKLQICIRIGTHFTKQIQRPVRLGGTGQDVSRGERSLTLDNLATVT